MSPEAKEAPNGFVCSRCPLLDLGVKLEPRDPRDPWRRMPRAFQIARATFGNGFYNHRSPLRVRVERLLGHYCRVQREKYGPCSSRRIPICHRIVEEALAQGAEGTTEGRRIAFAQWSLKNAVNDPDTHALLKPTVIRPATKDLRMPPITLTTV